MTGAEMAAAWFLGCAAASLIAILWRYNHDRLKKLPPSRFEQYGLLQRRRRR